MIISPATLNPPLDSSFSPPPGHSETIMGHSPSNCTNGSDPDKTLPGSLLEDLVDESFSDTQNFGSVVSTNGSDSPAADGSSLVPVPEIPREEETLIDYNPAMEMDENEHNLETSDYPYDYHHSCRCNRLFSSYCGFRRRWPGPCGPCCEYDQSSSHSYGPRYFSRERWRNRDDQEEEREKEDMPYWRSLSETVPTGVGAGLCNLGNTCFINAILQSFTHTVPLVRALRSCNHVIPCQRSVEGFCVVCALRDHIELSLASSGKAISPSKVVDNLKHISSCFEKYQQEDAHEFLQCLLDKLESCCLDPDLSDHSSSTREDNIVEQVFGGRLVSKLRCCNCGHCSEKYEPLIDLSLEIEDVETLQNALDSFTKVEKIEDVDTKFVCDRCKEEVSREKQLMLDQAPSVAALHLKRFKTDGSFIEKIDRHVGFPLELDLKPYTNSSQDYNKNQVDLKYQLYAIVVHNGLSPTSGHYFCYVRSSPSTWHKLDDSRVIKVEEEKVLSQAAYILFYVRDGTPWFSSLIEPHKDSLDPNISNTSPKSVLDKMVTESTAYLYSENLGQCKAENLDQCEAENLDHHKASVSSSDVEWTSNHFSCVTVVEKDQINGTRNDAEGISVKSCNGTGDSGTKLLCDESRGDISMNDVSGSLEASDSHDKILGNEKLSASLSVENNCDQDANRSGRIDGDPSVSPRSSRPDLNSGGLSGARHHIRRDHLKVEHSIKKPKKAIRDERAEALRYISKNGPASRRLKFMAAILPQNDKKRILRSSPCKQATPPGSRSKITRRSAVLH